MTTINVMSKNEKKHTNVNTNNTAIVAVCTIFFLTVFLILLVCFLKTKKIFRGHDNEAFEMSSF